MLASTSSTDAQSSIARVKTFSPQCEAAINEQIAVEVGEARRQPRLKRV